MTTKVDHILNHEIACDSRDRRETPVIKRVLRSTESRMTTSPKTAMKLLVRGKIRTLGRKLIRPNLNETETIKLRENYEFSANMYKFIYSENEQNADNYLHSGEDKPRHFYSRTEAKKFVDDVSDDVDVNDGNVAKTRNRNIGEHFDASERAENSKRCYW